MIYQYLRMIYQKDISYDIMNIGWYKHKTVCPCFHRNVTTAPKKRIYQMNKNLYIGWINTNVIIVPTQTDKPTFA